MDLSQLAPADGVVALRSLERRYRGLFAESEEDGSPQDIATRRGEEGWTALEHIVAAARDIGACARGLQAVQTEDEPVLDPADIDPAARPRPQRPTGTVHERLAELGLEASLLADRVEEIAPGDWDRLGIVSDGTERRVTALDLLRTAVDSGVSHLRRAEHVLAEVRDQT